MRSALWSSLPALLLLMLASAGCGPGNPLRREAVSGMVTFDGQPIVQGSIGFEPSQPGGVTSGAAIVDGKYEIEEQRGLPPGRYRVRINSSKSDAAAIARLPPDAPEPPGIELIPAKYNVNSDQWVEVTAGQANTFDFQLQR